MVVNLAVLWKGRLLNHVFMITVIRCSCTGW